MKAINLTDVADAPALWQELVDASSDGWIWHTWLAHEFNVEAGREYGARDLSFFVYEGDTAVGVVPLVIEERNGQLQAAYYSGFLPWPCCIYGGNKRETFEDFAFTELERRARIAGVERIIVRLASPPGSPDEEPRAARVADRFGYTQQSFDSHIALLDAQWRTRVRDRYRRYVRKFSPFFELWAAERGSVTPELEEEYFRLHVTDAGKQVRSRESYTRQADLVRGGEGFYVIARDRASWDIVGMLLVSLYKNVGLDNSVAVDPTFVDFRIGHLLRMFAMEELERRNARIFELPGKSREGSSPKMQGISHFKEGWTGGVLRTTFGIEKILTYDTVTPYG